MARGQSQAAQKQLGVTNAIGANELSGANAGISALTPEYTSLMKTGYFNPQQKEAATTSEMGATAAPFQAAGMEAKNNASATRNASNLPAQQDQLALEEGQAAGKTAAGLQTQQMANQEAGAYGLGQLTDEQMKMAGQMYGLGPSTLQARAAGPSGDQTAMGWINTAFNPGGRS